MTKTEQRRHVRASQRFGERWFSREIGKWHSSFLRRWKIGSRPSKTDIERFRSIRKRGAELIAVETIGTDFRKADDPWAAVITAIATAFSAASESYLDRTSPSVNGTIITVIGRAERDAVLAAAENPALSAADLQGIASSSLERRLANERLTIAVTDTNWTVQTARNTAVITVRDPLGNSVSRLLSMIEGGDLNGARRLDRLIMRLARLPLSVSEGSLIRTISDQRDRLLRPEAQAGAIARVREVASRINAQEKVWLNIGDSKVRESHIAANNQRRALEEPFDLEGGRLQYPGDSTLGASLGEIVRCRCMSYYE